MRTKNEQIKNFIRGLAFGLLVVALIVTMVGCDKKKDNNGGRGNWWGDDYYRGRRGYGGNGVLGGVVAGMEAQGRALVILGFSTDSGDITPGATWVDGEMEVFTPMACSNGFNGLEKDIYRLIPYNGPATLQYNLLGNVVLIAQGRYNEALITIPYAYFSGGNVCGFTGMIANFTVESVDGMQCGIYTTLTDNAGNACY